MVMSDLANRSLDMRLLVNMGLVSLLLSTLPIALTQKTMGHLEDMFQIIVVLYRDVLMRRIAQIRTL